MGSGFQVLGFPFGVSRFVVSRLEFVVFEGQGQGSGFRVRYSGLGFRGCRFRLSSSGFGVRGYGFGVFEVWVSVFQGSVFRVSGSLFGV